MEIDARILGEADKENCDHVKEAVSKYGVQLVCDDEDEKELHKPDLVLPESDGCENIKKVASKVGYQVVCDDEA